MGKTTIGAAEIRVLSPGSIEDFHAHLVRLDRGSRFPGEDDRAIDTHCLGLIAAGAILIGAFVDGVIRAAAEIIPDRTARRAEAAITIESGFHDRGLEHDLAAKVIDEAQRHHLNRLRINEQSETRHYLIPVFQLQAYAAGA
jgi:hypothetical protein